MKLKIIEIQALEYGLKNLDIHSNAWYRSEDGLINPSFFNSDGTAGYVVDSHSFDKWSNIRVKPNIFTWLVENLNDRHLTDPMDALKEIKSIVEIYPADFEWYPTRDGFHETFKPAHHANIKFRDGLVLNGVLLNQPEYDLVGFEQN